MRTLWRVILCGPALLVCLALAVHAWDWEQISLDTDSLTLGDPLALTLSVRAATGESVVWPLPHREQLGGWRLLGADSLTDEPGEGGRLLTRRLLLARYQLGEAALPTPGPLREGRPSGADTLRLYIQALLPDTMQTAADILPPARLRHGLLWWLGWIGLALAALGLAWLGRRWWLRRGTALAGLAPEVVLDPWEAFLLRMSEIERLALWRSGAVESHYMELSLALRGLLEDCLGLPCRERSTLELRELLRGSPLTEDDQKELILLLEANDWVKYARQWPDSETNARQIDRYQKWALARKDLLQNQLRLRRAAAQASEGKPASTTKSESVKAGFETVEGA